MPVSLKAVATVTAGGILAWTGLTSQTGNPRDVLIPLLAGHAPAAPTDAAAAAGVTGGVQVSAAQSQISTDALAYAGHPYCYGGAQAAPSEGCPVGQWDCSSFVNWVLGHDLGLAIPGFAPGTYDGTVHGPTTLEYLVWAGGGHIPRAQLAAGDLCVWQTHMGIAVSNSQMISAQNPSAGTAVSGIDGFIPGEILYCERVLATLPPSGTRGKK